VRHQALWVVVGQLIVTVNGALICYAIWGALSSRSALIGGVVGAAATLAQVLIGMRGDGTGLVRGSTTKLVVTAVLLVAAMRIWRIAPEPLFLTYLTTFLVYWLGLARSLRPHGC
jgi:F0F1-type ATP synthase assembly protein I